MLTRVVPSAGGLGWSEAGPAVNPLSRDCGIQGDDSMNGCKWRGLVMLGLCGMLGLGGCAQFSGVERMRDELTALRERAHDDLIAWEARVEEARRMEADAGLIGAAEAGEVAARLRHAALDAAARGTSAVLLEAREPSDPVGQVVGVIAPWLPGPVRTPLVLGAAGLATLARARQLKRGLLSVATSLREAMSADEALAAHIRRHADTLRKIQTPAARRIVDESDPTRPLVRLPI